MATDTCPSCGGAKSKRAELCTDCRRRANALGAAVITQISAASTPFTPRTPKQNAVYHGRLRDIALIENPNASGESLWQAERELKAWSIKWAGSMVGRTISSSTELSELEFERMNEWLANVIDSMRSGAKRPR